VFGGGFSPAHFSQIGVFKERWLVSRGGFAGRLGSGTLLCCHRSISIVADGRFDVCDGAHWAFVMKKR
jgi:hypothetical protein